jgi:hypothetical protein
VTINGGCGQDMSVFRDAGQGQEMTNSRSEKSQPRAGYRCPLHNSAFGRTSQRLLARSRTALTQADRVSPLPLAASSYSAFLASLMRIVRYSLSPFSTRGLPRGVFMADIVPTKNPLTQPLRPD